MVTHIDGKLVNLDTYEDILDHITDKCGHKISESLNDKFKNEISDLEDEITNLENENSDLFGILQDTRIECDKYKNKIKELEDIIKNNLLCGIRCNVSLGDTVWYIDTKWPKTIARPVDLIVRCIHISSIDKKSHIVVYRQDYPGISKNLYFHRFNDNWFLTEKEANDKIIQIKEDELND
jgi:hypothetical protein